MNLWHSIRDVADKNGWNYTINPDRFERDGYEVYSPITEPGYELTIRDPETRERVPIFKRKTFVESPLDVAMLMYILENVEEVVEQCSSEQQNEG